MEREKKKFEKEIETEKNKFINELKTVGKENIVGNYKPKKLSFFEKNNANNLWKNEMIF